MSELVKLRAADFEIRDIKDRFSEAKAFVSKFHYSKGCSHTAVYAHGLFRKGDDTLLGVAFWLPPTKPAAQSVNKDHWRRVLSLSRLCVHPSLGTNAASFLMARSIRLVREIGEWVSLVTYADEFMKHTGQIYKATNWTYVGKMKGSVRWEDPDGKQVSVLATKSRTVAQMEALGFRKVGVFDKHKFVMHLTIQRRGDRPPIRCSGPLFWAIAI